MAGHTAVGLAGYGVNAGTHYLVIDAECLAPSVGQPLALEVVAGIFKAPATGVEIGDPAMLFLFKGAFDTRQQRLEAGMLDIALARLGQRLVHEGDVGRSAQVVIFGAVERVQGAVGIRNRLITKTGQSQALGDGNEEAVHGDGFALGAFLLAWLYDRPAGSGQLA